MEEILKDETIEETPAETVEPTEEVPAEVVPEEEKESVVVEN